MLIEHTDCLHAVTRSPFLLHLHGNTAQYGQHQSRLQSCWTSQELLAAAVSSAKAVSEIILPLYMLTQGPSRAQSNMVHTCYFM